MMLLQGASDATVAEHIGVDRTTVYRWRTRDTAFQELLEQGRAQAWQRSLDCMQSMLEPALEVLKKQMLADDPKCALRAASLLLRLAPRPAAPKPAPAISDDDRRFREMMAYVNSPMPGKTSLYDDDDLL